MDNSLLSIARIAANNMNSDILPSEELLRTISFKCSYPKSTNDLVVTEDIVRMVMSDSKAYETVISNFDLSNYIYRIKTPDSILRKFHKYSNRKFQSLFNDLLGLRIKVKTYDIQIPDYFRLADMRYGKANDDGYRALHLYYKLDNYHYQVEIQLWQENDYNFNLWSHTYGYKTANPEILLNIRRQYDMGNIKDEESFRKLVEVYSND